MVNIKKTFGPQIDARDCGEAALAFIGKYYGLDYSLTHLRELAQTNKEGTTALGIVKAAKEMGVETRAIQADMTLFQRIVSFLGRTVSLAKKYTFLCER